jgi:hypothetical protein
MEHAPAAVLNTGRIDNVPSCKIKELVGDVLGTQTAHRPGLCQVLDPERGDTDNLGYGHLAPALLGWMTDEYDGVVEDGS